MGPCSPRPTFFTLSYKLYETHYGFKEKILIQFWSVLYDVWSTTDTEFSQTK